MKTKTFLLLCLFFGIGLNQLSGQNGKNGSGTVHWDYPNSAWWTPIYCNGVQIDLMIGSGDAHGIDNFVNGVWQSTHVWYSNGVGTSLWTGETFTFKELDKWFDKQGGEFVGTTTTQVKGDQGTLYNMTWKWWWDGTNLTFSVQNATCTGNSK